MAGFFFINNNVDYVKYININNNKCIYLFLSEIYLNCFRNILFLLYCTGVLFPKFSILVNSYFSKLLSKLSNDNPL